MIYRWENKTLEDIRGVSISIGSIKTYIYSKSHEGCCEDTKEQKQNNLAFKYLVDISVARTRLSTKLIYFLSFFKN